MVLLATFHTVARLLMFEKQKVEIQILTQILMA